MLTKSGNLSGLDNLKQSQLNLGVIQSLTGEVFSTDNCVVIENANGVGFRFLNGLQVCLFARAVEGGTNITFPSGALFYTPELTWVYPLTFLGVPWVYNQCIRPQESPYKHIGGVLQGATSSGCGFNALTTVSHAGINLNFTLLAIGFWK